MGVGARLLPAARGWVLFLRTVPTIVLLVLWLLSLASIGLGIGLALFPAVTVLVQLYANGARRVAATWGGVEIDAPYRPEPDFGRGTSGAARRVGWLIGQRATWRDALWLFLDPIVGATIALVPLYLLLWGTFGLLYPWLWNYFGNHVAYFPFLFGVSTQGVALLAAVFGAAYIGLGLWLGPRLLRLHAHWTAWLLRPTQRTRLTERVSELSASRADVVDTQAAELRRIERDLHDGAQARLVAMGMSLGAAEALIDSDPDAARTLLVEARASSATALAELRALVRGIHPPVLADRGLADAVRSLALEIPLDVSVDAAVPDRLDPAVESAVYFAVSELLANAAKHARASRARVVLSAANGTLRAVVTDDGRGGADPARGTGLTGLRRRLGAFDGTLALASPVGGPTIATLEVPCG